MVFSNINLAKNSFYFLFLKFSEETFFMDWAINW